jgi:hypothetical protein
VGAQKLSGQFQVSPQTDIAAQASAFANRAGAGPVAWQLGGPGIGYIPTLALNQASQFFQATGLGFQIPDLATIRGVQVDVLKAGASLATMRDSSVPANGYQGAALLIGGAPTTVDHASPLAWSPVAGDPFTYGGPTDLWGQATITPAQVNDPSFGFLHSCYTAATVGGSGNATIYTVTVTVTYDYGDLVIADSVTTTSTFTQGATALQALSFQPDLVSRWSITSWSVSYLGALRYPSPTLYRFGRLGSFWAGIITGPVGPTPFSPSWRNPMTPFPADLSTFAKIWDGTTDPPFPSFASAGPPRYAGYTNSLPQPIAILPGDQILFGLWLTPGLVQNTQTIIRQFTWTIAYDDGLPAR